MNILNDVKSVVRNAMAGVARALHAVSGGRITANQVSVFGLFAHILVVFYVVQENFIAAGILLIIFGLLDSVDGALARLQKKESDWGMVLDATTDRMKEGMVLGAVGYHFARTGELSMVAVVFAVLVLAVSISYVKAKAEVAIASSKKKTSETNRVFSIGLGGFEVRVALVAFGLLFNQLVVVLWLLLGINSITFLDRCRGIYKQIA